MTEEVQVAQTAQTENNEPQVTQQDNPDESRARESGWVPKEEWTGDPEKWRPAKDFNDRGELFGKIDTMGKELKETRKALKMLQEHHTKVRETEYNRALTELKALQKQHLEEGNADGYLQTTELLTDLKAEQKAREVISAAVPQQQGVDPRFTSWTERNQWYAKDAEMRKFADAVGLGLNKTNPELDPEEILEYVSKEVKQRFKDKFENPNRNKPGSVESSGAQSQSRGKGFQLTDEERKVMNTFVRQKLMTADEYIAQVKAMRG